MKHPVERAIIFAGAAAMLLLAGRFLVLLICPG